MTARKLPISGIFRSLRRASFVVVIFAALLCRADEPLLVTLVSDVKSIQSGQPFTVGLHLHHGAGHHTYWKFPGVVGVPTSINWYLPEGFTAGPIEWPAPERVRMGKIVAQGYERDVILPVTITPPKDLKPGTTIKLEGRSGWMSCGKRCNPGFTDVRLDLPVKTEMPAADEAWRAKIAAERSRIARPRDAWTATATEHGEIVTLTLTPANERARKPASTAEATRMLFFTTDGWIYSDKPQTVMLNTDGSLTFTLPVSDIFLGEKSPATLNGILQNDSGWLADGSLRSLEIAAPISR